MSNLPISQELLEEKLKALGAGNPKKLSIRETVRLSMMLEEASKEKYIHFEMGVPGLKPPKVATLAEKKALDEGLAAIYPPIEGIKPLKEQAALFAKNFLDIDINPTCVLPTVGSMQACMASFMVGNRCNAKKTKTLFIDPGFPVNKAQLRVMGMEFYSFDVYNYRGEKLEAKLREFLDKGDVATILYSSPNNPSWINFTEQELQIIARLSKEYDVIILEDLAYFGMDFRNDISKPGVGPFNPTVAKYTNNYILLLSGSKSFSYAGQRIAVMMISQTLFNRNFEDLKRYFSNSNFGHAMIFDALYTLSTGTSHTAQWALAAILEACNNGSYNFIEDIKEYEYRAKEIKKMFLDNNFKIVYDKDGDKDVSDGFYFTIEYPGLDCSQLIFGLLRHGIAAIGLNICNSDNNSGLRICVSQIGEEKFATVKQRLDAFNKEFSK